MDIMSEPLVSVVTTPLGTETGSSGSYLSKPRLFDPFAAFSIRIKSGVEKICQVRYPSDKEWFDRTKRQKIVRKNLGRGKSMPIPSYYERDDAALFEAIRLDKDGEAFDEAEAAEIIARLDAVRVEDVKQNAAAYDLKLKVMGYSSTHTLRMPLRKEAMEHERASVHRMDDNKLQILRMSLEPSRDLYDKLFVECTGYVGNAPVCVPANHKYAVVFELLSFIEREMDADEDGDVDPEA